MKDFKSLEFDFVHNPGAFNGSETTQRSGQETSGFSNDGSYRLEGKKYKIMPGYILRKIAGEYVVIPVGAESGSPLENSVLTPNDTAVFIWKSFQQPSTLDDVVVKGLLEYDVDEEVIRRSIKRFIIEMVMYKVLEEV